MVLTKKIGDQPSALYELENFPAFLRIKRIELDQKIVEQVKKFGVEIKEDSAVSKIEKIDKGFLIKTQEGRDFKTKAVIIATGRKPKKLEVPGAKEFETKGVSFCSICDGPLFREKRVAGIGGGNAAMASVKDLLAYAKEIYVLHHSEKFAADEASLEQLKKISKVHFIINAETKEIKGDQFVKALVYEDKKTGEKKEIPVEGVFINIGQSPNTDFAKDLLQMNKWGEIMIDFSTNQTSVPGIFAAGDCTNIPYKQYIIAAGEGAKAALSAHNYLLL